MTNLHFENVLEMATLAASLAGDKWLNENPKGDACCGFAWIEFTDRRTVFAKWYKKKSNEEIRHQHPHHSLNHPVYSVSIDHKHRGRQDWTLNEVCIQAAYDSLKAAGITGIRFKSRID